MKDCRFINYTLLYFNNSILSVSTIYLILARHKGLPEDDVLTSKHVAANHMYLYVIKILILCNDWSNYNLLIIKVHGTGVKIILTLILVSKSVELCAVGLRTKKCVASSAQGILIYCTKFDCKSPSC